MPIDVALEVLGVMPSTRSTLVSHPARSQALGSPSNKIALLSSSNTTTTTTAPNNHIPTKKNSPIRQPIQRNALPIPARIHTPKIVRPAPRQLGLDPVFGRRSGAAIDARRAADDGAALGAGDGADVQGVGFGRVDGRGCGRRGEQRHKSECELHFGVRERAISRLEVLSRIL